MFNLTTSESEKVLSIYSKSYRVASNPKDINPDTQREATKYINCKTTKPSVRQETHKTNNTHVIVACLHSRKLPNYKFNSRFQVFVNKIGGLSLGVATGLEERRRVSEERPNTNRTAATETESFLTSVSAYFTAPFTVT